MDGGRRRATPIQVYADQRTWVGGAPHQVLGHGVVLVLERNGEGCASLDRLMRGAIAEEGASGQQAHFGDGAVESVRAVEADHLIEEAGGEVPRPDEERRVRQLTGVEGRAVRERMRPCDHDPKWLVADVDRVELWGKLWVAREASIE